MARADSPAWTSNNLEGSFSLENVAPTLLEGSIWRLRLEFFAITSISSPIQAFP